MIDEWEQMCGGSWEDEHGAKVTADVQRELAEALAPFRISPGSRVFVTVQALIADAEKRAAAAAVRWAANDVHMPYEIRMELHARAASLEPANATSEVSS